MIMAGMKSILRVEVVEPLGQNVVKAAEALGVRRAILPDLLSGRAALSTEMALRFEKVFAVSMEMMLKMQAAYDAAQMWEKADAFDVECFVPV